MGFDITIMVKSTAVKITPLSPLFLTYIIITHLYVDVDFISR